MPALKNNRRELFAQGLAQGKTASEAYAFAGYNPSRKNASRMTANEDIQARVAEIRAPALRKVEVTVERLAEELGHISLHDLSDVLKTVGSKVYLLKPLSKLPKAVTASIASLKSTKDGIEVKFHDKLGAIALLGKHKGMFKENVALTDTTSLSDLVIASYEKGRAAEKVKAEEKPKKAP